MNCACMSVGKAGKGAVERESGLSGPLALTLIQSGLSSTVTPASRRPASIACISAALAPTSSSEPPVMARSEVHTSELPSLMRTQYGVFCLNNTSEYIHYYCQE